MGSGIVAGWGNHNQWDTDPNSFPPPHEALTQVEVFGISRSDWHLWLCDSSWMGIQPELPLVLGHEMAGFVEAEGSGVRGLRIADRVTLPVHMPEQCSKCGDTTEGALDHCVF